MLDYPSKSGSSDVYVQKRFATAVALREENPTSGPAKTLLKQNAAAGDTAAMVLLGDLYADGTAAERQESLVLFKQAAAAGDSCGMRNLGYCLAVGLNCERNKDAAAEWYRRAAEAGNPRAMCNLGVLYAYGHGVSQDLPAAFQWYLRSAEGGYPRGMTNVGEMYLRGIGTSFNADEAERWFLGSGSPRAYYHLAEMYLDGIGRTQDSATGRLFLQQSAYGGYSKALYRLGTLIEREDPAKAREYYEGAARKGNRDATVRLESLGFPVPERTPMGQKKEND
ncbi:MAG: tetratricopeptide repeat protein [Methanomethylophilus sp.]